MKSTYLSIPEPCHQPWGEMTPNEQGRFCSSCEKTVVDLKGKSDREIVHFFDNKTEKVCARIPKSKLDIPLYAFEPENNFTNLKAIILGTAILTSFVGFSEEDFNVLPDNYLVELVQNEDTITSVEDTLEYEFVVKDSKTNEPLPLALVVFYGENELIVARCYTDFDGIGKILISAKALEETKFIEASMKYDGYDILEISKKDLKPTNNISLKLNPDIIEIQGIIVGGISVSKKSIRKNIRDRRKSERKERKQSR